MGIQKKIKITLMLWEGKKKVRFAFKLTGEPDFGFNIDSMKSAASFCFCCWYPATL